MSILKKQSSRRTFLQGVPVAAGGLATLSLAATTTGEAIAQNSDAPSAKTGKMWSNEYWAQKGEVKLNMFRKRMSAPQSGKSPLPVLFLVHGSSTSSRTSYDLTVPPGKGEYSFMDTFAGYGFDVWTMDFEGYGRSTRTEGNSDIASGVEDLKAAMEVLARETGLKKYHFFGESSGAIRAGAFAMARPDCVDRLALAAFTYTGKGSSTLADRAKQVEFYRTHNRRPRDRKMIESIFTRDKPGTSDPTIGESVADAELKFGDTVPTGTYLDMTANLPLVDPQKVHAPVLLVRGEYDGIATEEDLLDFLEKLPTKDYQYNVIPGAAHSIAMSLNRRHLWHILRAFLEMPARTDGFQG